MLLTQNIEGDNFLEYLNSEDALFHYTKKCTALEKILPKKQLKFGSFRGTNDPQEYRPKLAGAVGWGWDGKSDEVTDVIVEINNLCQQRSRFLSFCTNRYEEGVIKEYGYLRSRMWAQYGDNHEGACIVLSKSILLEHLKANKNENHELLDSMVKYRNPEKRKQPILHVNKSDFEDQNHNAIALKFFIDHKDKYLFSKQTDYRDECEFRVVIVNRLPEAISDVTSLTQVDSALKGVVFGDRFPNLYSPTVKLLVKDTNVITKQIVWDKAGYHIFDLKAFK